MAGETELRPLPRIHERRTTGPRAWRCACVTQVACAADGMVLRRKRLLGMRPGASSKTVGMPRSAGNKTRGLLVGAVPRVLFWPGATCPDGNHYAAAARPSQALWRSACRTWPATSSARGAAPATRRRARPGRRHAALAATGADCGTRPRRRLAGMHADGGALLPGQLVDAQVHLLATRGVQTRIHVFAVDIGVVRHHAAREGGDAARPAWGDSRGSSDTSP